LLELRDRQKLLLTFDLVRWCRGFIRVGCSLFFLSLPSLCVCRTSCRRSPAPPSSLRC